MWCKSSLDAAGIKTQIFASPQLGFDQMSRRYVKIRKEGMRCKGIAHSVRISTANFLFLRNLGHLQQKPQLRRLYTQHTLVSSLLISYACIQSMFSFAFLVSLPIWLQKSSGWRFVLTLLTFRKTKGWIISHKEPKCDLASSQGLWSNNLSVCPVQMKGCNKKNK